MKIGIIGAGQLGKDLYLRLRGQTNSTYLYSRQLGFDAKRLEVAKEIVNSNDVVINCAAMTNVDLCESEHQDAIAANVILPQNLALLCEEHNVPFVHISTDYVYGANKIDSVLEEDMLCNPINFYGETKLIADNYILQNNKIHLILRPSWLFGPGQNNFIYKILNKLQDASNNSMAVVNDQFGVPTSTSLIADVIEAWLDGQISNGLYNIRNEIDGDGCPSRYRIADFMKEVLNSSCEIKPCSTDSFSSPAQRQKNSFLSIDKLRDELKRTEIEKFRKKYRKIYRKILNIPCWKTAVNNYVINAISESQK